MACLGDLGGLGHTWRRSARVNLLHHSCAGRLAGEMRSAWVVLARRHSVAWGESGVCHADLVRHHRRRGRTKALRRRRRLGTLAYGSRANGVVLYGTSGEGSGVRSAQRQSQNRV